LSLSLSLLFPVSLTHSYCHAPPLSRSLLSLSLLLLSLSDASPPGTCSALIAQHASATSAPRPPKRCPCGSEKLYTGAQFTCFTSTKVRLLTQRGCALRVTATNSAFSY
jgi:hypothetical protein